MSDKVMAYKKKICMIGAPGVGKTSLVRRYVYDLFEDKYLSTIGVKISQKICPPMKTPDGQPIQYTFLLWDIEGVEDLLPAVRNYYMGASGALVVTDLTRKDTIEAIPDMIEGFRKASPEAEVVLAGNKLDLVTMYEENLEILAGIKNNKGLPSFLTSAKSGQNVENAFFKFVELFSQEKK